MKQWHLMLHRRGASQAARGEVSGSSGKPVIETLDAPPQIPFSLSFDQMVRQIEDALGGYCEPDGALGWHPTGGDRQRDSSGSAPNIHVGGTLHCVGEQVVCVELFAELDAPHFEKLTQALAGPDPLCVQLVEQGLFVSAESMSRLIEEAGKP